MNSLPDKVSAVTPIEGALDGTAKRKPRGKDKGPRVSRLNHHTQVDPRVLAEAKALVVPGVTYLDMATASAEVVYVRNVPPGRIGAVS